MLSVLPVEILLDIIQSLPLTTVASFSALSKSWAKFMIANESSMYHNLSKQYGYTLEGDSGNAAPAEGWKTWCKLPSGVSCEQHNDEFFSHPEDQGRTPVDRETPRKPPQSQDTRDNGAIPQNQGRRGGWIRDQHIHRGWTRCFRYS